MLIIVSKDINTKALNKLKEYGTPVLFNTENITYKGIENHPDVFLTCINQNKIIAAPNTPPHIVKTITDTGAELIIGKKAIGNVFPQTAPYNVVVSEKFFIHNLLHTDTAILAHTLHLGSINITQAYTRCNLLALPGNRFITSDKGILKTLLNKGLETIYANPEAIRLKGFKNGFFGGCCGMYNNMLFINGSLDALENASSIRDFILKTVSNIIELTDAVPEDVGSILFIKYSAQ